MEIDIECASGVGAWMNQLWLFEKLRDNDSLRLSSPVLTSFYNNFQNGNIGTISNIDLALATLFNFSGGNEDFITQYNNSVNANSSLVTTEDFELNMQFINHIALIMLRWGVDSLNEIEKLELELIAKMCPFVGGSAVYKARVLYSAFNPIMQYNDRLMCIQGQNKNGDNGYVNVDSLYEAQTNEEANKLAQLQGVNPNQKTTEYTRISTGDFEEIVVFPNPTCKKLFVGGNNEDAFFQLYDVLGNLLLTEKLIKKNTIQKIVLPDVSSGIYQYKIIKKNVSYSGKLNILNHE